MSASHSSGVHRDFSAVANELMLLPTQVLDDLLREATEKHVPPEQLALKKGLLDSTQVDIVETLMRPTEVVPGYEILSVLGQGGMGVVYRARQLNLQRIVALKTVLVNQMGQKTAIERFEREAQAVARLTHPNIVTAYDFGRHQGRLYFAMELVAGEDVGKLIRHRQVLDERTTWEIMRQAAAGLAHAVHHGIVHRDIKPANLLLVEPPAGISPPTALPLLKIADFGLAQLAASGDEQLRLTATNVVVGSPHYMSPEQLLGEPLDLRTDIFALGCTAFHMLTGKPPQADMPLAQIVSQRVSGEAESIRNVRPQVSKRTADLVAAMMEYDPRRRIASYVELTRRIDELDAASSKSDAIATDADPEMPTRSFVQIEKHPRWARQRWLLVGIVALLAIVPLVVWLSRDRSPGYRDLKPTGRIEELFNGRSINAWKPLTGEWSPTKDDEGAIVMQGRGTIRRPIASQDVAGAPRSIDFYRLSLVVDLHEAAAAEVQFDLARENHDNGCLFVRIDRQGSTLGTRDDAQGSHVTSSVSVRPIAEGGTIHAIEIERHSQGWWALVDGNLLGTIPFRQTAPAREFRLRADGGFAWFYDFVLEELEPYAAPP